MTERKRTRRGRHENTALTGHEERERETRKRRQEDRQAGGAG